MDAQEIERRFTPRVKDIVCYNTHLRIVNQIIYKEFIFAKWEGRNDWAERASVRLEEDHGISRTPETLKDLLSRIKNRTRNGIAASDFTQGISYDSIPSSRYEKDAMHARMETLICEYLDDRRLHYVGLPANQIVPISNQYNTAVACEKDSRMAQFMLDMNRYISKSPHVKVFNGDIFEFLNQTDRKFNVFEFDMMCALNSSIIRQIAQSVLRTALSPALIAVVSIGGRHISAYEYEVLMPGVLIGEIEKSAEWSIINNGYRAGGKYKDIKIPMRYELLVIQKDDDDIEYDPEYYEMQEEEFVIETTETKSKGSYSIDFKSQQGRILKFLKQYCPKHFSNINKNRIAFTNITKDQFLLVENITSNLSSISGKLTPHQRKILHMYVDGLHQVDIGKMLGIHQSSVHKALHGNIDYIRGKRHGGIFRKILKSHSLL